MSFLNAVKADCEAGNMVLDYSYHRGFFRSRNPEKYWDGEEYYSESERIDVTLVGRETNWWVNVYPDCENTVRWLQTHGLLDDWEVIRNKSLEWNNLWKGAMEKAVAQGEEGTAKDIPIQ